MKSWVQRLLPGRCSGNGPLPQTRGPGIGILPCGVSVLWAQVHVWVSRYTCSMFSYEPVWSEATCPCSWEYVCVCVDKECKLMWVSTQMHEDV